MLYTYWTPLSPSVRAEKRTNTHEYLHPGLEFWFSIISNGDHADQFERFGHLHLVILDIYNGRLGVNVNAWDW